jgi:hypothetical protein
MPTLERSVVIEASVHEVFEYASDWKTWPDWYDGFSDVSPITDVEKGNGAIYSYKMSVLGFPFKAQTEVFDFVENRGWSGRRVKGVPHSTFYAFEDLSEHTRFTTSIYYSLPIPILGPVLCSLFFNRAWRRILERSLSNLDAHFQK